MHLDNDFRHTNNAVIVPRTESLIALSRFTVNEFPGQCVN